MFGIEDVECLRVGDTIQAIEDGVLADVPYKKGDSVTIAQKTEKPCSILLWVRFKGRPTNQLGIIEKFIK